MRRRIIIHRDTQWTWYQYWNKMANRIEVWRRWSLRSFHNPYINELVLIEEVTHTNP